MVVRELRENDHEPLYALYRRLALLMPPHPIVDEAQFARELTTVRYQEDERWDASGETALVAEEAGERVAFVHASFLADDGRYTGSKAGEGTIRFLFAAPERGEALETLLTPVVEHARSRECSIFRALAYGTPLFHNCGCGALSNAWPWVGKALTRVGFVPEGRPALGMRLDRIDPSAALLPEGARFVEDWTTRVGQRDDAEGGLHVFVGDDRAAETMWHFGQKYVEGAGKEHAHLFWLGSNPPYRSRGFARTALRESLARAYALGARSSDLRCNPDNFNAHALYRAEGYVPADLLWTFRLHPKKPFEVSPIRPEGATQHSPGRSPGWAGAPIAQP